MPLESFFAASFQHHVIQPIRLLKARFLALTTSIICLFNSSILPPATIVAQPGAEQQELHSLLQVSEDVFSFILTFLQVPDLITLDASSKQIRGVMEKHSMKIPDYHLVLRLARHPCRVTALQPCLPEMWCSDEGSIAFVGAGRVALQLWLTSGGASSAWRAFLDNVGPSQPVTFCASLPDDDCPAAGPEGLLPMELVEEVTGSIFLPLRYRGASMRRCFRSPYHYARSHEWDPCQFLTLDSPRTNGFQLNTLCSLNDMSCVDLRLRGWSQRCVAVCGQFCTAESQTAVLAVDIASGDVLAVVRAVPAEDDLAVAVNNCVLAVAYYSRRRGVVLHTVDLVTRQRVKQCFASPEIGRTALLHQDLAIINREVYFIAVDRRHTLIVLQLNNSANNGGHGQPCTAHTLLRRAGVVDVPVLTGTLLVVFVPDGLAVFDVRTGRQMAFRSTSHLLQWGAGSSCFQPHHFHADSAAAVAKFSNGYFVVSFGAAGGPAPPCPGRPAPGRTSAPQLQAEPHAILADRLRQLFPQQGPIPKSPRTQMDAVAYTVSCLQQFSALLTARRPPAAAAAPAGLLACPPEAQRAIATEMEKCIHLIGAQLQSPVEGGHAALCHTALARIEEASRVFRGQPLDDGADADAAEQEIDRLATLREADEEEVDPEEDGVYDDDANEAVRTIIEAVSIAPSQ
eukprot:EG_transcript_4874